MPIRLSKKCFSCKTKFCFCLPLLHSLVLLHVFHMMVLVPSIVYLSRRKTLQNFAGYFMFVFFLNAFILCYTHTFEKQLCMFSMIALSFPVLVYHGVTCSICLQMTMPALYPEKNFFVAMANCAGIALYLPYILAICKYYKVSRVNAMRRKRNRQPV